MSRAQVVCQYVIIYCQENTAGVHQKNLNSGGQIELLRLQVGPESGILNSGLALDGYRFRCSSRIELTRRPFAKFTSSIQTPEHPATLYYMQKFFDNIPMAIKTYYPSCLNP